MVLDRRSAIPRSYRCARQDPWTSRRRVTIKPGPHGRTAMNLKPETLKAMIADYGGIPLTDAELELVRPEVDAYVAAARQLDELDLAELFSSRLLRVAE